MAMNNSLTIIIDDENWLKESAAPDIWCRQVFSEALAYLQKQHQNIKIGFNKPICINLSLSNNVEVQKLNNSFRGLNKPTNVLSFANIDDDAFWKEQELSPETELGDIIIALETLKKEAEQKHIPLQNHLAHLLVHGILHLFGFDHQTDVDADKMENIEIEILQRLNIDNPYKEL